MATIYITTMDNMDLLRRWEGVLDMDKRYLNDSYRSQFYCQNDRKRLIDNIYFTKVRINKLVDDIKGACDYAQKMKKMKNEIVEKSLQMMYHPTRVARLLDAGLISFEEDGSFENL
jgi:hypothetical protein